VVSANVLTNHRLYILTGGQKENMGYGAELLWANAICTWRAEASDIDSNEG
jgi:hypothetical protein